MKYLMLKSLLFLGVVLTLCGCQSQGGVQTASLSSAAEIDAGVRAALRDLYAGSPEASALSRRAKGILVFPRVTKACFIGGVAYGEGALLKRGRTVGYYSTAAGSYGLQAGIQTYGYVLFFMSDSALAYLDSSGGLEVGVGPSVVVVDKGMAKSMTTTTAREDVYAFIFDQKGLMAGLGIQGSKITRIEK